MDVLYTFLVYRSLSMCVFYFTACMGKIYSLLHINVSLSYIRSMHSMLKDIFDTRLIYCPELSTSSLTWGSRISAKGLPIKL